MTNPKLISPPVRDKEIKTKLSTGNILLGRTEKPKKYRLVIDFDSSGFWQLRRSLQEMPRAVLLDILESITTLVANKKVVNGR